MAVAVSAHVWAMADLSGRRRLLVGLLPLHAVVLLEGFESSSFGTAVGGTGAGAGGGVSLADLPVNLTTTAGSASGTFFFFSSSGAAADFEIAALGGVVETDDDRRENESSTTVLGTVLAVDARRSSSGDAVASVDVDLANSSRSIRRWTDVLSSRGSVAASESAGEAGGSGLPPEFWNLPGLPELLRRIASAWRVRTSPGMTVLIVRSVGGRWSPCYHLLRVIWLGLFLCAFGFSSLEVAGIACIKIL